MTDAAARIAAALGEPVDVEGRAGGSGWCDLRRVRTASGAPLMVKLRRAGETLDLELEARMLRRLDDAGLPVPQVHFAAADILAMDFVDTDAAPLSAAGEAEAAEMIASLHATMQAGFGYAEDTVIGALPQPNPATRSWCDFFRQQRLLHMAGVAREDGGIDADTHALLERLAGRLGDLIDEPAAPALLHGDLWGGNVLTRQGRIAAFIDPAVYFGHPEIELAFSTLFATFGDAFYRRYAEIAGIAPGFFEIRRDLYNLYPLLVHAALFGAGYGAKVRAIAARFA
jgi:fructosamine-3-kinase